MKNIFENNTLVADAICSNPSLIMVLERLGINLGVQDKSLNALSLENNLNPDVLVSLFNLQANNVLGNSTRFNFADIRVFVSYLRHSHAYYSGELYPEILRQIETLLSLHEEREFKMLNAFFLEYIDEVDQHFAYENDIVFPYISQLYDVMESGKIINKTEYSVCDYKKHHDNIEEKLADVKNLLIRFLPPGDDMKIRRQIIFLLSSLDGDLEVHARIENEILIPLVERLERKLISE